MTDQTTHSAGEPRLGAALIFGGDAAICVHVHTGPAGVEAIWERLDDLAEQARAADERVRVAAVLGVPAGRDAVVSQIEIPAADMEDVIALAKGLDR